MEATVPKSSSTSADQSHLVFNRAVHQSRCRKVLEIQAVPFTLWDSGHNEHLQIQTHGVPMVIRRSLPKTANVGSTANRTRGKTVLFLVLVLALVEMQTDRSSQYSKASGDSTQKDTGLWS